jgi:hypothetical protein
MANVDDPSPEQFSEPSPRCLLQRKCCDDGDPIRKKFDIGPVRLLPAHETDLMPRTLRGTPSALQSKQCSREPTIVARELGSC